MTDSDLTGRSETNNDSAPEAGSNDVAQPSTGSKTSSSSDKPAPLEVLSQKTEEARRAIKRLVDLYSGLMALALFEAIREVPNSAEKFAFSKGFDQPYLRNLFSTTTNLWWFLAFCSILFPFFQGTLRYFDNTYLEPTPEIGANFKRPKLAWDYFFFLSEAGLLLWMGALVQQNHDLFVVVYGLLLFVDVLWLAYAVRHKIVEGTKHWLILNSCTLGLILICAAFKVSGHWPAWLWLREDSLQKCVLIIAPIRGVIDYVISWSLYFPPNVIEALQDQSVARASSEENAA